MNQPWYEVRIRSEDQWASRKLGEAFLEDFCSAHDLQGLRVSQLYFRATQGVDCYLLPPDASRIYFGSPYRSAISDWLRATGMAKPAEELPDITSYSIHPCSTS